MLHAIAQEVIRVQTPKNGLDLLRSLALRLHGYLEDKYSLFTIPRSCSVFTIQGRQFPCAENASRDDAKPAAGSPLSSLFAFGCSVPGTWLDFLFLFSSTSFDLPSTKASTYLVCHG